MSLSWIDYRIKDEPTFTAKRIRIGNEEASWSPPYFLR